MVILHTAHIQQTFDASNDDRILGSSWFGNPEKSEPCEEFETVCPVRQTVSATFTFLKIFINFFVVLAVLGLHCFVWAFSSCSEPGSFFIAVCRLLIAVASLIAKHRF